MADPDDLFIVKNHYWIGNYRMAIEEGSVGVLLSLQAEHLRNERDYYVLRSHIGLHDYNVIEEIQETPNTSLVKRLMKLYCMYIKIKQQIERGNDNEELKTQKQLVFLTLNEWLKDINAPSNPYLILIAAEMHMMESNYSTALSIAQLPSRLNLEQYALCVQIYLKMSRIIEAEKIIKDMQKIEEDSTLTQLAQCWVWSYQGNPMKCQESLLLYKELSERFGTSTTLLQNMGIAYIHMKKYRDAEKVLLESFNQDRSNAITIINLITVGSYICSDENQLQQLISALQEISPRNPWLEKYTQLSQSFDRIAMQHQM